VDDCTPVVGGTQVASATSGEFANLIANSPDNKNQHLRDIFFPEAGVSCDSNDNKAFDFKITVDGQCWMNTHVDNLEVYDFTYWTIHHPGNSDTRNPIKEFAETFNTFELKFPDWHAMGRWDRNKKYFLDVGRFNDTTSLKNLPNELFSEEVAKAFGGSTSISSGGSVVVCGSPFEVANVHSFSSGTINRGGFDMATRYNRTSFNSELEAQKNSIWMETAIKAQDQLRQRVAWALSQILVMSPGSISTKEQTESFITYYDIFVRNAFGNYFDILKEVTYSPMMAEMLSYLNGRSTGYEYTKFNRLQYADENFAREVMQLFSIGLNTLNDDGTLQLDIDGNPIRSYTNEDITEYARVYTGFRRQRTRGNIEDRTAPYNLDNQVDPLQIRIDYRDHLPKVCGS
jgi:hypothetical protein